MKELTLFSLNYLDYIRYLNSHEMRTLLSCLMSEIPAFD